MLLKPRHLLALNVIWLSQAGFPHPARADTVLVLLDNSGSIARLTRTYQDDILAVLGATPHHVFFAPIGDVSSPGVLVDSADAPATREQNVKQIFGFKDLYTKIDASLKRVEDQQSVFQSIDRILIVSDMEPDLDMSDRWSFNKADLEDLNNYLQSLGRWAGNHRKPITLILHGWSSVPIATASEIEDFPKEITWKISTVPMSGGNVVDKGLVVRGLRRLLRDHPQRVTLQPLPLYIQGEPNEEEFRDVLCSHLNIRDSAVCWTIENEKTEFRMRIDFDRRILLPIHLSQRLRDAGDRTIHVGPPRTIHLTTIGGTLPEGHDSKVDIHFSVSAGTGGKPFYFPTLSATVQKDGRVEPAALSTKPTQRLTSEEALISWVNDQLSESLRTFINDHYPPESKLKKIYINGADGEPLPAGYRVQVISSYPGASPVESITHETRSDAATSIKIPTFYDEAAVYLRTRFDSGGNLKEGSRVELFALKKNAVKKRADIRTSIDPGLTREFSVTHSGHPPTQLKLEFFLRAPEKEFLVHTGTVRSDSPHTFRLLPGSYRWEAVPEGEPGLLASAGIEEVSNPPGNLRTIEIPIKEDPLADQASWDIEVPRLVQLGSLTGDAIDVVKNSSETFRALFRHTSTQLATGQASDVSTLWQAFADVIFNPNEQGTMERRLGRGFLRIGLLDADGKLHAQAYVFARAAFNIFLTGNDQFVVGDSPSAVRLRQSYNAWLSRITDYRPGDNLISPDLRDRLRAKQ